MTCGIGVTQAVHFTIHSGSELRKDDAIVLWCVVDFYCLGQREEPEIEFSLLVISISMLYYYLSQEFSLYSIRFICIRSFHIHSIFAIAKEYAKFSRFWFAILFFMHSAAVFLENNFVWLL